MHLPNVKHVLIGKPFPTSAASHERLDKVRALAVFASDPISSNAYATEAIMSVLIILGTGALALTMPIALAIAALVALVVFSYTQTILHYPKGGGAYIVAKDNLGATPSLIAGAALLTDYILTVSVSVSAGVRAIVSAFPDVHLHEYEVPMALAAIAILTWLNLRGVRESGTVFAFPTYAFVGGVLVVILIGLVRYYGLFGAAPIVSPAPLVEGTGPVTGFAFVWLLLRAFAAGCTALTGIEAISDGVPAFKAPEAKNAASTMLIMGVMAMTLFLGISFMATHLNLVPRDNESILSQMTRAITGGGPLYYWVQLFTMLILILAANTAYQDFPRLSYFLARDGYLPRWMTNLGSRLVYSSGIAVLAVVASLVVIVFRADEIAMLPLYALGVMISFTVSQAGMFRLWSRIATIKPGEELVTEATVLHHETGLGWKRVVNGIGALTTFVVLLVLIATKFLEGAWIIAVAIPLLIYMFRAIKRHYVEVAAALRTRDISADDLAEIADVVIVPIGDVHRGTLRALKYAKRLSPNVRAVMVLIAGADKERVLKRWNRFPEITRDIELVFIDYEYRDLLTPLVAYILQVHHEEYPNELTTVVLPEFVPRTLGEHLLHNQTANMIRLRLHNHEDIVVVDVPYHIGSHRHRLEPGEPHPPLQIAMEPVKPSRNGPRLP
jgi:amino acid transporter